MTQVSTYHSVVLLLEGFAIDGVSQGSAKDIGKTFRVLLQICNDLAIFASRNPDPFMDSARVAQVNSKHYAIKYFCSVGKSTDNFSCIEYSIA